VGDHRDAMAGRLAAHLNGRTGRPVGWRVVARSGLDARGLDALLATVDLGDPDVVLVSLGVNDVKDLRSDASWRTGLGRVLDRLAGLPRAQVFLLGLPPVERFPSLPRPLADLLGGRARRLDRIAREVAANHDVVARIELTGRDLDELAEPFAADGFHPGPPLHDLVAREVVDCLTLTQLTRRRMQ